MRFEEVKRRTRSRCRPSPRWPHPLCGNTLTRSSGKAQNDYMLEKFQSVPALRSQLESGYRYFFACTDAGERIGFLAFYPRGNELYLSKFYLQKDWRGRGLAWEMLRFVLESARALGLGAVELNVNRDNDAARAYERMGFVRVREEKNDIGAGFCMDDFVYRYDP